MLPVLVFCGCVLAASYLWDRHMGGRTIPGEVADRPIDIGEVVDRPIDIIPLTDGRLVDLPHGKIWRELDEVQEGNLLVKLDPGPTYATLRTMKSEVLKLRADLAAAKVSILTEQADRLDDQAVETRRLAVNVADLKLEVLDRQTRLESNRIQRDEYQKKVVILRKLVADGVENEYTLADAELVHKTLVEQVKQEDVALKEARATRETAIARHAEHLKKLKNKSGGVDEALAAHLDPIAKAITTQNLLIEELEDQISRLEICSTCPGKIVAIMRRPGQNVRAGEIVMTVAPLSSKHVISYIPEDRDVTATVGDEVKIKVRSGPGRIVLAKIDSVGPRVELIPLHHLRDPNIPQWGVPIRIEIPDKVALTLKPGQLVDVLTSSKHIITYLPENRTITAAVGDDVKIKVRSRPSKIVLAKVDRVGPRVEPVPLHQLRDPNIPQWGVPIRIEIPEAMALTLKPGQLVDVLFRPAN